MNRRQWSMAVFLFAAPFLLSFALMAIARWVNQPIEGEPTYSYEDSWLAVVQVNWFFVLLVALGMSALYLGVISLWNRNRRK